MVTIPRVAGAPRYRITTSCGGWSDLEATPGDAPLTGLVSVNCAGPIDVVAAVIADTTVLQSFAVTGIEVVPDAAIDLTAHAYTPAAVMNLSYVNVPSEELLIAFYLAMPSGKVSIGADDPPVTGGSSQSVVEASVGAPLVTQSVFTIENSRRTLVEWGPATGTDATLDIAPSLLPAYTSMPAYDITTHSVSWTSETGGLTPQVTRFAMLASDGENFWDWHIVGPYTGNAMTFPTIPITRSIDFNRNLDPYVLDLETASVPYDAIRANAFSYEDLDDVIAGESGRVASQTLPRDHHEPPF
jgi:hypothetical protein